MEPGAAPPSERLRPARGAAPVADLQLAITRTGIGLELTAPVSMACLSVLELSASLPDLRFPLDVSGGVARFRHRRGRLERLVVEAQRALLEAWAAPRLRGVLGVGTPKVTLFVRRGGATVGVADLDEMRCLAFEVELDVERQDLALSVHDARGIGLTAPTTLLATRVLHALAGDAAERRGARFVIRHVATDIARHAFADRGARAPETRGIAWGTARGHDDAWLFVAQRGDVPAEPLSAAVVAREACALAEAADDAAFALDLEKARALLIDALERAPRHTELSRRLAELDRTLGGQAGGGAGRAEAALATLRDAEGDGTTGGALLSAQLLRDTGDRDAASAAFVRAGETEPVGPLAGMAFDAAADLARDPDEALALLDRAIARAPAVAGPRWRRISARLAIGRVSDARADAEHLEALATSPRARHAVWLRAGQAFRERGWLQESAGLFERALRYAPRDPLATAGLGAALVSVGKVARGAQLLTQAVTLGEAGGAEAWSATMDLAQVLAENLDDKPAAIARLRDIPARAPEALRARALEGRWRSAMGDLVGAGLAFVRARDLAEARLGDMSERARAEALAALLEAAKLESDLKGDWLAAQRHLAVAIRLAPRDESARSAFRVAGQRLAALTVAPSVPADERPAPDSAPTWTHLAEGSTTVSGRELDEALAHGRVEELTRKLHADPSNDEVVDELSSCLLQLGRTHELFALLQARLDEAPPDRRAALLPKQREVLVWLEEDARSAGRAEEAALYREAQEML